MAARTGGCRLTAETPRPRAALAELATYTPGRTAAAVAAEHGLADAVKLASNELAFGPLPSVTAAMAAAGATANRYPDHRAVPVRVRIAEGLGVDVDWVSVGCGSVGLLQQLTTAFAGPGDEIAFGWRSFEAYPVLTAVSGASEVRSALRRFTLDPSAVSSSISPATRLVFLANPNNPTGTYLPASAIDRLLAEVPTNCLVVLDEAYREFVDHADAVDGVALVESHPNVAVLRTFSKAYGLAALRIGYLIARPEVVAAVDAVALPFAVNAIAQAAAVASLDDPAQAELRERVRTVRSERARVARTLRGELGLGVPESEANFLWLPAGAATGALGNALEKRGVVGRSLGEGVRVTIGTQIENDRFIDALDDIQQSEPDALVSWGLATGDIARNAQAWIDRASAVEDRLTMLAASRRSGRTAPDHGGEETWGDGEAWAHIAEFGGYWLRELGSVLTGSPADPPAFGRTKVDPVRRSAIADGAGREPLSQLAHARRALATVRHLLAGLNGDEWGAAGRHSTLGLLDMDSILEEFLVGHYEQHAAQLETLAPSHG
ncbi:MAG TPA: histidinol-phosphate transaminase [Acidimicrobiales bacterium]|nr:histidinol-phosphate transaminase [Acidimicrobiales bacterium]